MLAFLSNVLQKGNHAIVTSSVILASYFSTLQPSSAGIIGSIIFSLCLAVLYAVLQFVVPSFLIATTSRTWRVTCSAVNFVSSASMFMLMSHARSRLSSVEVLSADNAFGILLLAFCRVACFLSRAPWYRFILDGILGPTCFFLLCFLPSPSSSSCGGDAGILWINFLVLTCAQLFQPSSDEGKGERALWITLARGIVSACGIGFFWLRSSSSSCSPESSSSLDFHLFRSLASDHHMVVQVIVLLWAGMSCAAWYSELLVHLDLHVDQKKKEVDQEDARSAVALAGILLGMYCCMSPCQFDSGSCAHLAKRGSMMMRGLMTIVAATAGTRVVHAAAVGIKLFNSGEGFKKFH